MSNNYAAAQCAIGKLALWQDEFPFARDPSVPLTKKADPLRRMADPNDRLSELRKVKG
jgi:hypothetical protein